LKQKILLIYVALFVLPNYLLAKQSFNVILLQHTPELLDVIKHESDFTQAMLEEIFKETELTPKFIRVPLSRTISKLKSGAGDCIGLAPKGTVSNILFPKEPWGYHEMKLYMKTKPNQNYKDVKEFKKLKLGIIGGMTYDGGGKIDKLVKENKKTSNYTYIYGENAFERIISMYEKSRVDGFFACPLWLRSQKSESNAKLEKLTEVYDAGVMQGWYVGCTNNSPKAKKIISIINDTIPKLRASKKLAKILKAHGFKDWHAQMLINNSL